MGLLIQILRPEALGDGRLENWFMVSGSRFTVVIDGCRMQGSGFRVEKERQTKCSIGPIGFIGWIGSVKNSLNCVIGDSLNGEFVNRMLI